MVSHIYQERGTPLMFRITQEPVETRWPLTALYSNQKRMGFTFQTEVLEWFMHLEIMVIKEIL